ncbi:MAG: hypothetical protein JNG84_01490 [Archangium sp.]|nr:hypothetical protein [Archangium sp.]
MKRTVIGALVALSVVAHAQTAGKIKDGKVVKSARDEISRLQKEVDDQRALLIRILELQQQQYGALLKLARGEASSAELVAPDEVPVAATRAPEPAPVEAAEPRSARAAPAPRGAPQATQASVTGKVSFSSGNGPAWVFVEDVKGSSDGAFEVKQEDKQFIPRMAAVPRGTKLVFANADNIFHNVFSVSPGNAFDIGNTRSGEAPKGYTAANPGVIELFCNLHAKMSAAVLVTPGPLLARVQPDGTFKLDRVPVGPHRVGAWAGGTKIVTKDVEVTASGGTVNFELAPGEGGAHKNKHGQSYGSYAD